MSIIFFEGFNRRLDSNFWTIIASSQNNRAPFIESWAARTDAGGGRLTSSDNVYGAATHSSITAKFSPATLTKVYIGLAVERVETQSGQSGGGGVSGAKQKTFTVYDGSDIELFNISARAGNGGLALSLYRNDHFSGNTPIGSFIINSATNIPGTDVRIEWYSNWLTGWNYLEFEIDLVSNTIAARRNGQTLYTENTGALTVLMPTAMPSVGAFRIHGHPANEFSVDDMYVATSAGTTANTWLGLNTRVYSPVFGAGTPAEWSNGGNAAAVNSDDNDTSFISTNVINKINVFDTGVSPSPADAVVGGVKLTSTARKVTLDASYRHVYKHTDNTIHNLSSNFDLTTTAYTRSSAFVFVNPATDSPWTLADLDSGKFGVKSVEYSPATGGTPVITIDTQPASQTPTANSTNTYTVSLAVSASATESATLSYQWQKAEAEDPTTFTNISGAVLAVLSRPGLSYPTADGDKYRVTVSATGGADSVTSAVATITIPPLTVPDAPTSVTGVSGNEQITVSWAAPAYTGGTPILDYRVATRVDGGEWSPGTLVGSDTTSLLVTGLINGTGYRFKVLAVNAQGDGAYSAESNILVPVGEVLSLTAHPVNAYAATTESVDFTVAAAGTGLEYQWAGYSFSYETGDFLWVTLAGETAATLTLSSAKLNTLNLYAQYGPLSVVPVRCNVTDVADVTVTTKTARLVLMNTFGLQPSLYSYYGSVPNNSFEIVDGVRYDQYTPDQNAASNLLYTEIYDYSMGPSDYSWFTGDEFSAEFQISDDRTTWTTISTPITGHYISTNFEIPVTTGTKYYRWLVKYLWPLSVTNTTVNSPENSVQPAYVFPITNFKIDWPSVPAVPTNVVGYPDNNQIVLFWAPPTNNGNSAITGYNIQTSTDGTNWSLWGSSPVNATSANITGLVNGTPYYFRVAAINIVGAGDYSAASTAAASVRSFAVTNSGAGQYLIDGVANPTLTLVRGSTYKFAVNAAGHPFHFQTVPAPYSAADAYTAGITGSGTEVGEITFIVPTDSAVAPDTLYYVCELHSSMSGQINIVSGVVPFVLEPVSDLAFGSVSLLLHFDDLLEAGAVGTVTDSSQYTHAVYRQEQVISTTTGRFGNRGVQFTGGSSTYLSVPAAPALDMDTADFTIEFWLQCANNDMLYPSYLSTATTTWADGSFTFRYDESSNDNKFRFYWNAPSGVLQVTTSNSYSYNRWRHVAIVREGTTVRLYVDGVQDGTMGIEAGRTLDMAYGGALNIGFGLWDGANGYVSDQIDELRITKGLCRFPGGTTFTPATVPFANFGPPAAPTNLQLTTGDASVTLTWTAPVLTGGLALTDYVVQFSTNGTSWSTFTDDVSTTASATVTGLVNGTTYYFQVAAVNTAARGDFTPASSGVIPTGLTPVTYANKYNSGTHSVTGTSTVTASLTGGAQDTRLWLLIGATGTLTYTVTANSESGYDGGRLYLTSSAPAQHSSASALGPFDAATIPGLTNVSGAVSGTQTSTGTASVTAGQYLVLRYAKDSEENVGTDSITAVLSIA